MIYDYPIIVLGPIIPYHPLVIYRGVMSLRHNLAPNVVDPPKTISFFQTMKGFFPYQKCSICQINTFRGQKCEIFQSSEINKIYNIESFITCSTVLSNAHVLNNTSDTQKGNYMCGCLNMLGTSSGVLKNIIYSGIIMNVMIGNSMEPYFWP